MWESIKNFFESNKGHISFITSVGLFMVGFILNYRARRIQSLMVFKEFREPVIKFANDTIDVMSELEGLCECNPKILEQDFFNKYNSLITKVSSLRDKGRLLIPNNFPEKYGSHKSEAYQGFRHEVLDCLTAAYYLATSINYNSEGHNKQPINIKSDELLSSKLFDSKSDEFKSLKQIEKIKQGLDKLPDDYPLDGHKGIGWSSKTAIIETKRQFVSKIQKVIQTRSYGQKLIQLGKQKT